MEKLLILVKKKEEKKRKRSNFVWFRGFHYLPSAIFPLWSGLLAPAWPTTFYKSRSDLFSKSPLMKMTTIALHAHQIEMIDHTKQPFFHVKKIEFNTTFNRNKGFWIKFLLVKKKNNILFSNFDVKQSDYQLNSHDRSFHMPLHILFIILF